MIIIAQTRHCLIDKPWIRLEARIRRLSCSGVNFARRDESARLSWMWSHLFWTNALFLCSVCSTRRTVARMCSSQTLLGFKSTPLIYSMRLNLSENIHLNKHLRSAGICFDALPVISLSELAWAMMARAVVTVLSTCSQSAIFISKKFHS